MWFGIEAVKKTRVQSSSEKNNPIEYPPIKKQEPGIHLALVILRGFLLVFIYMNKRTFLDPVLEAV
jgi:hypothetical protein